MRRFAPTAGLAAALVLLAPLGASAAVPPSTGNLIVLVGGRGQRAAAAEAAVSAIARRLGARPAGRSVPQIGLITVRPPAGVSLLRFADRLARLPGVASVSAERRFVPRVIPNDPALTAPSSDSGTVQWALAREGFYNAWNVTQGDGALVAVIDSGIDGTHPDLRTKIAAAANQQQASDAMGSAETDEAGHGTHVASLACADTNNGIGMAGAGYDCRLIVEKTDFTQSSIDAAIVDAANRGAQAINMSFGADPSTAGAPPADEIRALQYAAAHGSVLVAAAADSPGSEQGDPANIVQPQGTGANLSQGLGLDVTAAAYNGNRASFAGFGSEISMAAYGALTPEKSNVIGIGPPPGIFGAFPATPTTLEAPPDLCGCRTTFQGSSDYAYLQGTSMAAPQVAAAAAMLRVLNPYASVADVVRILKQTAQRPGQTGWTQDLGWGILDAGAAVAAISVLDREPPIASISAPRRSRRRTFLVRWSGKDPQPPGLTASGVGSYVVYVQDGHRRAHLLARTTRRSRRFRGRRGHRYTFAVYAVDRAGNRSTQPARAITRVLGR